MTPPPPTHACPTALAHPTSPRTAIAQATLNACPGSVHPTTLARAHAMETREMDPIWTDATAHKQVTVLPIHAHQACAHQTALEVLLILMTVSVPATVNVLPASAPLTMPARTPVPLPTVSVPTWTVATALTALTATLALAALTANAHPTAPPALLTPKTATALRTLNAPAPTAPPATPVRTPAPPLKATVPTLMAATALVAQTVCPRYARAASAHPTVPAADHSLIPASVPATLNVSPTSAPPTYASPPARPHKPTANTKMDVTAPLSMSVDPTIAL